MTDRRPPYIPEGPERWYDVTPVDAFSQTQLQMTALKGLGYPVDLQPATMSDAFKDAAQTALMHPEWGPMPQADEWRESHARFIGKRLIRPVVFDPDFLPYARDIDVRELIVAELERQEAGLAPGTPELLDLRMGDVQALHAHPGPELAAAVGAGRPMRVQGLMSCTSAEGEPLLARPIPGGIKGLLAQSYVRAVERYEEESMEPRLQAHEMLERADIERYNRFKRLGVTPVSAEALGGLMEDYYKLFEQIMPAIARFRKPRSSERPKSTSSNHGPYLPEF